MPLKGLGATVGGVATDLAREGHVEAVKLVEPVGNGLRLRAVERTIIHTHKTQDVHKRKSSSIFQYPLFQTQSNTYSNVTVLNTNKN